MPPLRNPVVLIDLPRPRLVWWRELTADGLAARLGPAGRGPASALRMHEAWRCRARRRERWLDVGGLGRT